MGEPIQEMKTLLDDLAVTRAMFEKIESQLKELEEISEKNALNWEELYELQLS